ncbi:MAG: hypothetical protein ACYTEQ_26835 [Planctomycetota bacterium]|jgi:hypothetical protein
MAKVKRFNTCLKTYSDPLGKWVCYSDYEQLEAEWDRLALGCVLGHDLARDLQGWLASTTREFRQSIPPLERLLEVLNDHFHLPRALAATEKPE